MIYKIGVHIIESRKLIFKLEYSEKLLFNQLYKEKVIDKVLQFFLDSFQKNVTHLLKNSRKSIQLDPIQNAS